MKVEVIKNFDTLLQLVCDPENQPHQFISDESGLKDRFELGECTCVEPPELDQSDIHIKICGSCKKIV